ncbi:MAG: radical SAM protein [Candidatus Omnitrophica bacterium]|nr:radical SAM protein [Candidatus Omnitrophota bacterium]MDD5310595.1 radical SAM protein [Candidatus Omnitrophota bacterium]MDD5545979.1 radical SAM protein [Candidatus Omnitrophota bacterium]
MKNNIKALLVYPNMMMKNLLPPSIGLLTACLKQKGFEVGLFDTTYYCTDMENPDEIRKSYLQVRSYDAQDYGISIKKTDVTEDFKKKVAEFKPDLIGVTVVEDTMPLALRLIGSLGKDRPPTIFGGIYISYLKEKAFENKEIDSICLGEGEGALVELCERMQNGLDHSDVQNLCFRRGSEVVKNKVRPLVDLDKLPTPDYSLFDPKRLHSPMQGKMYRMLPVDFDRGCPYDCSFCASPAYRNWYREQNGGCYFRKKDPGKIIEEMKEMAEKYRLEYLYFNSDTFLTLRDDVLVKLMSRIRDEVGLPFWCQSRVETISEDKVRLLKDCGCDRITVGLEHGNEEFRRKIIRKNFTNDQFIRATETINKVGVPLSVNNIIGFPYETRELIFDTIRLNRKVRSDTVSVFIFYPYTGTRLYDLCVKDGLIDRSVTNASLLQNSVIKNKNITKERLNQLLKTFCLYVKFPEAMWPDIEKVENLEPGSEAIFKKLSEEYQKKYF